MATFSHYYDPDRGIDCHNNGGETCRLEDYDVLEESCWHPRHTLAGIEERAKVLSDGYGSQYEVEYADLLAESQELGLLEATR